MMNFYWLFPIVQKWLLIAGNNTEKFSKSVGSSQ
uniref:Uncharacterized protein n=1 Tax=Rhizophora mucronata TaxID=61149 RepID=A0A2P2IJ49_RHIMU